jgi:hypothetical protein
MEKPPKKSTAGDVVQGAVGATISAVPFVGGSIAVVFATAMAVGYNRRLQTWFEGVAEAIAELQEATEDWPAFEELSNDDAFVDAVVQATRAAEATHQAEKLGALRNGVLNSVGPDAPSIDEQARFIRLVDQMTASHLRLLAFLNDPGSAFDEAGVVRPDIYMGGRASLIEALPEFSTRPRDWIDLLSADLSAAALTNHGGLHTMQTGASLWQSGTSDLGRRFLAFIRTPKELSEPASGR